MSTVGERVRKHRAQMRRAGMRPIQIWVPDTKKKGFQEECRRQSLRLRKDPTEKKTLQEIEKIADLSGWE